MVARTRCGDLSGRFDANRAALSLAHRLTAYDAAYLELCLRRGLALATFDEALSQAALSLGVDVIAS